MNNGEPRKHTVGAFTVAGVTIRTSNAAESDPHTAAIGALWRRFSTENLYERIADRTDAFVYGVYSSYEPDPGGVFDRMRYDVTAGVAAGNADGFARVAIEPGEYLVFTGKGAPPQAVVEAWQRIWNYFEMHPEVTRALRTDFEKYHAFDDFEIYVGLKTLVS